METKPPCGAGAHDVTRQEWTATLINRPTFTTRRGNIWNQFSKKNKKYDSEVYGPFFMWNQSINYGELKLC